MNNEPNNKDFQDLEKLLEAYTKKVKQAKRLTNSKVLNAGIYFLMSLLFSACIGLCVKVFLIVVNFNFW